MFNFDYISQENIKKHDLKRPEVSDHPYRISIIGGSSSGKTNSLLNQTNSESDIDKNVFIS